MGRRRKNSRQDSPALVGGCDDTYLFIYSRFCIVSSSGVYRKGNKSKEPLGINTKYQAKKLRDKLNLQVGYKKYWVARGDHHDNGSTYHRDSPYNTTKEREIKND